MITVKVTGNPNKAIKILKRLVNEEGIFNTLREQKYFTKKGEKRRLKKNEPKPESGSETKNFWKVM